MAEGIDKAAQEVVYTVLGHSGLESSRIPLNPNSLLFPSKAIDEKFSRKVMYVKDDEHHFSDTVKNNLILFYTGLTVVFTGIIVIQSIRFAQDDDLSLTAYTFHLVALSGLYTVSWLVLVALTCIYPLRSHFRRVYLLYMLLLTTYLQLSNEHILSKVTSSSTPSTHLNYPLLTLLFLYLYSLLSFAHFLGVLLISTYTLALYIGLHLYSPSNQLESTLEFLTLVTFCVFLCFRTHQTELRARHLFWRMEKEENAIEVKVEIVDRRPSAGATFNTERERLIELCESIKRKIKTAASVVIYKDIKTQLKIAVVEIEKVKKQVAVGRLNEVVKFDQSLDEQDREFIFQQFYHSSPSKQSTQKLTMADRKATMMNFGQRDDEEQLNGLLIGLGTTWSYDIWTLQKSMGHTIRLIGQYLFHKWEFASALVVSDTLITSFFREVEKGYRPNPYHNACHGADVCHSLLYFIDTGGILQSLTSIELGSAIIAALGHDIGHPGVTNRFLITKRDKIALRYNDNSVLENMHAATIYKILSQEDCNILKNLPAEDWIDSRRCIISMVLATDMGKHFEILGQFRVRSQSASDIDLHKAEDRVYLLSMAVKCADLGHSCKPLDLHQKWSELVIEEFFTQGDLEKDKGMPVSMYCDRDNTDVPKSQSGFLRNICLPLFETWLDYFQSDELYRTCLEQLKTNLAYWEGVGKVKKGEMTIIPQKDVDSPKVKRGTTAHYAIQDLEDA